ncbi:proline-rich protein 36-like [Triticum aestivum]|uniref:proline-rich protein 36-like n=1 Tax=Triticum aestivum TaxID=4565 RepID=UPI001D020A1E|nr:proline-rich protein 36-like [Triticum aestivum]
MAIPLLLRLRAQTAPHRHLAPAQRPAAALRHRTRRPPPLPRGHVAASSHSGRATCFPCLPAPSGPCQACPGPDLGPRCPQAPARAPLNPVLAARLLCRRRVGSSPPRHSSSPEAAHHCHRRPRRPGQNAPPASFSSFLPSSPPSQLPSLLAARELQPPPEVSPLTPGTGPRPRPPPDPATCGPIPASPRLPITVDRRPPPLLVLLAADLFLEDDASVRRGPALQAQRASLSSRAKAQLPGAQLPVMLRL